ncbi:(deoxy)nucleoside triphosphate pyrophosphohydrolase [Novosphingobium cyanobacteriorum]|uniref:8-oxo-dGTP diphosphatase n=1 Tax=Novosphingobium cyanobacteriorum TaxID=3024215 RepID=A0ABT6CD43_9SPHN|nr:(deoxy)nucleoside triphosphate pyrophosphohydrolase [Novosphingobium cyanobacteriorum]MDF8331855.1 (deoxy)nucleoside triphosphate pyrophosphohydrolase [Novosphingobium cyanobacteriorum]
MKSVLLPVVALAMIDSVGRVLMQQRPQAKEHGGLWEFPGGKPESGEGPRTALVREIAEELGVVVDPSQMFEITFASQESGPDQRAIVLLLYGCRNWEGEPQCLEPGARIAWVDRAAMLALPMPPLDVPLARALAPILDSVMK